MRYISLLVFLSTMGDRKISDKSGSGLAGDCNGVLLAELLVFIVESGSGGENHATF